MMNYNILDLGGDDSVANSTESHPLSKPVTPPKKAQLVAAAPSSNLLDNNLTADNFTDDGINEAKESSSTEAGKPLLFSIAGDASVSGTRERSGSAKSESGLRHGEPSPHRGNGAARMISPSVGVFSVLHSGYFQDGSTSTLPVHHPLAVTAKATDSSNSSDVIFTAAPPSPTGIVRVNEMDDKFNFHALNAMKQIYEDGKTKSTGIHFFTGDGTLLPASVSEAMNENSSILILEPNEYLHCFHKLSKDEIGVIVSFLPKDDNLNFGRTCKEFYFLSIQDRFWKYIILSLSPRERREMQTVFYQLDFENSEYNYYFSDVDNIYTPLTSFSKIMGNKKKGVFDLFMKKERLDDASIDEDDSLLEDDSLYIEEDLPSVNIGSINENISKMKTHRDSLSSNNSTWSKYGKRSNELSSTHSQALKRLPLKHQYILYKQHSKTVKKKERGRQAEDKIDSFFSRRCQPCIYFQLSLLILLTFLFIALSVLFAGLYFDGLVEESAGVTLLVVSPVGIGFVWLPFFCIFLFSLCLIVGWIPYVSSLCLYCYKKYHVQSDEETQSLLHPNDTYSEAESNLCFVILRRLFFSPEMQDNVNEPNFQLFLAMPSQLIWFSILVLMLCMKLLFFRDQEIWGYIFLPVHIFLFVASLDFSYRTLRIWILKPAIKKNASQLLTSIFMATNVVIIYLCLSVTLLLIGFKLDKLEFTNDTPWPVILTPSYVCLFFIHINVSLIPSYATKVFYNGFHSRKTLLLSIITPIPITLFILSPFTTSLILISLKLANVITTSFTLVLAPLYIGLTIYLLAAAVAGLIKFIRSKCCK